MNKIQKLLLSTSILLAFSVLPFGKTAYAYATDCGAEFGDGVGECAEQFLDGTAAGGLVYVLCFVKEAAVWVVCQIGNLL